MKHRSAAGMAVVSLCLAVFCASCVKVPKFQPDFVGMGDLPLQRPEQDLPAYPSAIGLPKLTEAAREGLARPSYRVGPQDILVVRVWGRPDLGSQVPMGVDGELRGTTVREDGTVVLPFLGALKVGGSTVEEIRSLVQARYATLVENPQIEVALHRCASQSVEITGAVLRPGVYFLCTGHGTVGEAISDAGGLTPTADPVRGILTRDRQIYRLDYQEQQRKGSGVADILMQNGDTIFFPMQDERVVYVFGEVLQQGVFPIPERGMSLLDALGMARGVSSISYDAGGIFLFRRNPGKQRVVYKLKMAEILQGPEIPLADDDRVFITISSLQRWDRWWRQALPFFQIRTTIAYTPGE